VSLEINRGGSPYVYRINPTNPLIIDRKANRHGARWKMYRLCRSEEEARNALLKLEMKS
jgi:hypothetical protein